jgi:site-specific recombinase XerD
MSDTPRPYLTLTDCQHQFVHALKEQGRANATVLAYGKDIEQLIAYCAKKGIDKPQDINHNLIEEFKSSLKDDGYTLKSISRKLNSIKSFFRFLKSQNTISDNPASDISHPKIELNPPRILTKIEYRALRDACRNDDRISAIVEILLQTGIRISELANLHLDDVDATHSKITIKSLEPHESRTIPLNTSAAKSLESYLAIRPKTSTPNLFVTKTGRPFLIRNIRAAIDRYFKLAGIENAKVNDLRHTFIAEQLAAGTPLVYVSKLVGHKRLTTTEKYLKFIDSKLEKNEIKLQEL